MFFVCYCFKCFIMFFLGGMPPSTTTTTSTQVVFKQADKDLHLSAQQPFSPGSPPKSLPPDALSGNSDVGDAVKHPAAANGPAPNSTDDGAVSFGTQIS